MAFWVGCCSEFVQAQTDTTQVWRKKNHGDVLEHLMVKRYRPADSLFNSSSFCKNIFLSVYGAGELTYSHKEGANPLQKGIGFSLGKRFSKFNTYRLSVGYMKKEPLTKDYQFSQTRMDAEIDHLFDLTSYLMGYDPSRIYTISIVEGLGLSYVSGAEHRLLAEGRLGVNFQMKTNRRLSLYAEPLLIIRESRDNPGNWHKWDWGVSGRLGAMYHFTGYDPRKGGYRNTHWMDNVFVQAGMGGLTYTDAELKTAGVTSFVNVGKWFNPLGVRVGLFTDMVQRDINESINSRRLGFLGGRTELMLNLNTLFKPDYQYFPLEANLFAGYEFGAVGFSKMASFNTNKTSFHGWTVGGQLVYYVNPDVGLLLESRYQQLSYSRGLQSGGSQSNIDKIFSLGLGLEIRRRDDLWKERKVNRNLFEPYWFTELSGGLMAGAQRMNLTYLTGHLGGVYSVALGRQFTPISGVRLGMDFENLFSSGIHAHPVSLALDYKFGITDFFMGYAPQRRLGVSALAGLTFFHNNKPSKKGIGFELGLEGTVKATNYLEFFVEPKLRLFGTDVFEHAKSFYNLRAIGYAQIGARYNFKEFSKAYSTPKDDFLDGFFISANTGVQTHIKSSYTANPGFSTDWSVGKWFSALGARFSIFASENDRVSGFKVGKNEYGTEERNTQLLIGGRAEGMIALADFWRTKNEDAKYDINLTGGVLLGATRNSSTYNSHAIELFKGFSIGTQLKWNVTPTLGLFIEPRFQQLYYSYDKYLPESQNGGKKFLASHSYMDKMFNIALGLQVEGCGFMNYRISKDDFTPYNYLMADFGLVAPLQTLSGRHFADILSFEQTIGWGRKLTALSGVRATFDVGQYQARGKRFVPFSFAADYMFNMTHWVAGYNPDRIFTLEPFLGVNYSFAKDALNKEGKNSAGVFGLEAGIHLNFKISPQVSLYLEPKNRLYFGKIDPGVLKTSNGISDAMQISLGAEYNLTEFKTSRLSKVFKTSMKDDFMDGFFLSTSLGIQGLTNSDMGLQSEWSIGKWFNFMGLRLSVFGAENKGPQQFLHQETVYNEGNSRTRLYLGGKVEGMLALADFWTLPGDRKVFDVNLSGGVVFGGVRNKSPYNLKASSSMHGYTLSAQLKWNITNNIGLFVEPGFQQLSYAYDKVDKKAGNKYLTTKHYRDNLFDVAIGLEIQSKGSEAYRTTKNSCKTSYFVMADAGPVIALQPLSGRSITDIISSQIGLAVGKQFTSLSALRVSFDFGKYAVSGKNYDAKHISGDYMLNLSNWFAGCDEDRTLSVEPFVGLGYGISDYAVDKKGSSVSGIWSAQVGVHLGFKINTNWSLYAEPHNRVYNGKLIPGMTTLNGRFTDIMSLKIGVKYNFNPKK